MFNYSEKKVLINYLEHLLQVEIEVNDILSLMDIKSTKFDV